MKLCLIVSAVIIAVIHRAAALECLVADVFEQTSNSEPCASFHTGCYEKIQPAKKGRSLEYKAHCAKGDECDGEKPENCLICRDGDKCNNGLSKRVSQQHLECYSYSGGVKQILYESKVNYIPQVKEQPVFCEAGINQCHRIQITEPDPEFAAGYSTSPNKISVMGGCAKMDCREFKFVSECLICSGRLCNSLTAEGPPVGMEVLSDDVSRRAHVVAGRSDWLLLAAAAAIAAVLSLQ